MITMFALVLSSAWAQLPTEPRPFPVLACPALGSEYEEMISKLGAIQTSIRKDANCSNVTVKLEDLEAFIHRDREKVREIAANLGQEPLNLEQARIVRSYAEELTKRVTALNDLFQRSNHCFMDDQVDNQLTALAGFVGEASQLVGSLSGPWGAPISLAGNVVAGFLTGLDKVLKSRSGYDFSKRDHWTSYVQNLCTYHGYVSQIDHLLDPENKEKQLNEFKTLLEKQLESMRRGCRECEVLIQAYQARKEEFHQRGTDALRSEVSAANEKSQRPYGSYILRTLGLRDWVISEIERVRREANGYWSKASGRYMLFAAKNNIEQFLIEKQAADFLRFGVRQVQSSQNAFDDFVVREGVPLYISLERLDARLVERRVPRLNWVMPTDLFRALVLQPIDWGFAESQPKRQEVHFSWFHFREQSLDRFRNAQTNTQVVQTFCAFFRHAGRYSSSISGACNSPVLSRLVEKQNTLADELRSARVAKPGQVLPSLMTDDHQKVYSALEALMLEIESRQL